MSSLYEWSVDVRIKSAYAGYGEYYYKIIYCESGFESLEAALLELSKVLPLLIGDIVKNNNLVPNDGPVIEVKRSLKLK